MDISNHIYQEKGGLKHVGQYFDLERKVLVVTDDGVPKQYVNALVGQCKKAVLYVAKQGEKSKSFEVLQEVLNCMLEHNFSREDAVIALGGGVVGDLSGLAAGLFMRGVDWYNIPATLLAQVDASIGGKTAINLSGIKNIVGIFNQPKGVLVDTELLETLSERQMTNGMMEVLKMGMILDETLVETMQSPDYRQHLDALVERSIALKSMVVNQDEKEQSYRRILNYGHTVGHGFESAFGGELLHGEAVACGMMAMAEGEVRLQLIRALENLGVLPRLKDITESCLEERKEKIKEAILHDKKGVKDGCHVVIVDKIGRCEVQKVAMTNVLEKVDGFRL